MSHRWTFVPSSSPCRTSIVPTFSTKSATWSSVNLLHSAQMMSFQISTSGSAGSCPGIQFLQQRQMARRTSLERPLGNQILFEPSSEWMGASVFAAVRTMLVCRRVCRIGVRIAALYQG